MIFFVAFLAMLSFFGTFATALPTDKDIALHSADASIPAILPLPLPFGPSTQISSSNVALDIRSPDASPPTLVKRFNWELSCNVGFGSYWCRQNWGTTCNF